MPICPNCGNQTADNAVFCDQCGTKLPVAEPVAAQPAVEEPAGTVPEGVFICSACGAENVPGEVFCDVCGEPLEAPEPVALEEAPEPVAAEAIAEAEPIIEEYVEVEPIVEEIVAEEGELVVDAEPVVEEAIIEEEVIVEAEPVPEEEVEQSYCPTCGAPVSAGDSFCGNCGASLGEAPAEEVPAEEPLFEEEPAEEAIEKAEPAAAAVVEEVVAQEVPADQAVVEEVVIQEAPLEEVTVEEVVIEEEPVEEVVEGTVEELSCSVCGATVTPDQAFCASCGAALQAVESAAPAVPAVPAGPYVQVASTGAHIPLVDQPQLLIGRTDDISGIYPEIDLTPHGGEEGGVSRRHARLIHEGEDWFIVDLDSTNGTLLNGAELQPKVRALIRDGDTLLLGDVEIAFHAA